MASAKRVFENWPTPIVFSGFEIGRALLYPAASIEKDFGYVAWHPVAESYRAYHKMPYDRPTWDLTAALQAVRPDQGYFGLSEAGKVLVEEKGATKFVAGEGNRRYMKLDAGKRAEDSQSAYDAVERAASLKEVKADRTAIGPLRSRLRQATSFSDAGLTGGSA